MNDSVKNGQVNDQDRPTGLMGTQFALNMAQGILDAIEEVGITKNQMLSWNQQGLRATSKKITQRILWRNIDTWFEEKAKISHFYKTCFKDKKWKNPDWKRVMFPNGNNNMKRLEFIFFEMTEQEAFDAYSNYFGKDKAWKAWDDITKNINHETVQSRPKQNYAIFHVGGSEPDLLNKSYNDGISENIIFMTPLEGIISAFRYRFETDKMYDVIGLTRFSAIDCNGKAVYMCMNNNCKLAIGSFNCGNRYIHSGLRQVGL